MGALLRLWMYQVLFYNRIHLRKVPYRSVVQKRTGIRFVLHENTKKEDVHEIWACDVNFDFR